MTDDATPQAEDAIPPESAAITRVREFLDSPGGIAVLLLSAAVALLFGPMAIYSLFAFAFVFRHRARRFVAALPLGPRTTLAVLIVLAGLLREVLTWGAETLRGDGATMLLHPDLGAHLLISVAIYAAWGLGWSAALWWYRYWLVEVLLIQALAGLVLENFGQTLIVGLASITSGGLFLLLYAMLVSASTVGLAWVLAGDKLASLGHRHAEGFFRYAAPMLLTGCALVIVFSLWAVLLGWLQVLPAPSPDRS